MAQMVKNLLAMQETQIRSLGQEDSLEKVMNSKLFPGEFHGQSSLAGYKPWDLTKLDMPGRLTHTYSIRAETRQCVAISDLSQDLYLLQQLRFSPSLPLYISTITKVFEY